MIEELFTEPDILTVIIPFLITYICICIGCIYTLVFFYKNGIKFFNSASSVTPEKNNNENIFKVIKRLKYFDIAVAILLILGCSFTAFLLCLPFVIALFFSLDQLANFYKTV